MSAQLAIDGEELSRWSFKVNVGGQQPAGPSNPGPSNPGAPRLPDGPGSSGPADIPNF